VLAEVNVSLDFMNDRRKHRFEPSEGSSEGIIASLNSLRETLLVTHPLPCTRYRGNGSSLRRIIRKRLKQPGIRKELENIVYEINTIKEYCQSKDP
jgi:hypothetical protein